MRPFYFSVTFWGERFRNYLTQICLPSLQLPTPTNDKILVCCPLDDWNVLQQERMHWNYPLEWIEIPPAPTDLKSPCDHMGKGHKAAAVRCLEDKAYSIPLTPDLVLSAGAVERLHELALSGAEVVLSPAMRFEEEKCLPLIRPGLTARQLVAIGMAGLHSETVCYEWHRRVFPEISPIVWWRGPSGMVAHSMSWAPLLLDYGAVAQHDTFSLDQWTMDGNYVVSNWGSSDRIHIVTDSDEIFLLSWAPRDDKRFYTDEQEIFETAPFCAYMAKAMVMRALFNTSLYDDLKKELFFLPCFIHSENLNEEWLKVSRRSRHLLTKVFGVPYSRGFRLNAPAFTGKEVA